MGRLENLLGAQSLALTDRIHAAEAADGRPPTERAALVTLLAHPDRSVSWLGDVLGLTSSGITRLVERLAAAGLVARAAGADARRRDLRLTAAGEDQARQVLRRREAALADVVAGLDAAERADLERLLDRVVTDLAHTRLPALQVCRMCDRDACGSGELACPLEHTSAPAS